MSSQCITCVAGGLLTIAEADVTVEHAADWTMTAAPAGHTWHVATAAPGWFAFRCHRTGQLLTVSGRDDTVVMLTAAAGDTRHHWRIIPYPERGDVVIISRVTGLALTAGSPNADRSAPVGLIAYHGAATQHWSLTDHPGASNSVQSGS
jgi:hypothetical protein